jgi:E3 ubiquitin-protein ligase TRIP12
VLVNLMNAEYNPDLMLMATRTLTHMIEALPGTCAVAVAHQAVPTLCAKLLTIEYIDLAEQSLTCLEKMSADHGCG